MLELVTAPAAELVSTVDAKGWLRVSTSDDDALIADLSKTARELAEQHTSRRFITQTWRIWKDRTPSQPEKEPWWSGVREGPSFWIDGSPGSFLDLELAPVASVSAIRYFLDGNNSPTLGDGTLLDPASYFPDTKSAPARVGLNRGYAWPTGLRPRNAFSAEFVVGYGAAASSVPSPIVTAVKLTLSVLYEKRGNCECELPQSAKDLLDPYVIKRL